MIPQRGVRKASGIASLVAANTPVTVYTIPAGRSVIIRKVNWDNRAAGGGKLRLGTGAVTPVAVAIPPIDTPGLLSASEREEYLDGAVINAAAATNLTAETTAAVGAAPGDMMVQVEVEEYPAV